MITWLEKCYLTDLQKIGYQWHPWLPGTPGNPGIPGTSGFTTPESRPNVVE